MTTDKAKVTAYLALDGNDAAAVLDDPARPFQHFGAAQAALKVKAQQGHPVAFIDLGILNQKK